MLVSVAARSTASGSAARRASASVGAGGRGPCYNGHSDGFELSGVSDIELVGNMVYDVRPTAAIFMEDFGNGSNAGDHEGSDLTLQDFIAAASQVIDTGTAPNGMPAYDITGQGRPIGGAWDRGPFESSP